MKLQRWLACALLTFGSAALAEDAEGCKDHALFNRMPNFHIRECKASDFDLKRFPTGAAKPESAENRNQPTVDVEGPFTHIIYDLDEGASKPSELQIMRNFEAAIKKAGGSIEGMYPGWCKAMYDYETLNIGNGCTNYMVVGKLAKGVREHWVLVQADQSGASYDLLVSEREAMKQDIAANDLLDKIIKEGFLTLYINFDTGKATIKPDSVGVLAQVVQMLKLAPDLKLEVGGHTDNVGGAAANLKLSEERARSVMKALTDAGIPAARLTAKGYGQDNPVADNRSEDGRAKNRRVELTKK